MLKRISIIVFCCLFLANVAFASITANVKQTVDDIIKIVTNHDLKKPSNEHKRRAAIKRALSGIFDQQEMAKRSLGRYWNQRTPAERKQFVDLFSSLLENSYAGKIESYNNEKIIYTQESVEGNYAEVRSKIITPKHDEYSLDYRLLKESSGKWMVYDIVIEGVSLVSNYRTQFNKIISANGYPELIKKLQTKHNEIKMQ